MSTWNPEDADNKAALSGRGGLLRVASEATSWLGGRLGLAANMAGYSFRGKRNLFDALGYDRVITPQMYRWRFDRGGIVERLVTSRPQATWRGGGELVEDEDPDVETPFEAEWNALNKRLKIWSQLEKLDILAGLGRYAVLLIGAPGDYDQPLEKATANDIKYLRPYSERDVKVASLIEDTKAERFGHVAYYTIDRLTAKLGTLGARKIHHSRCLHFADGQLDDPVYGKPRMEAVWNLLDDLDKVAGGGAEAFWKRADAGLALNLDPAVGDMEPDAKEDMKKQIEEYTHRLRRVLTLRGVEIQTLTSGVADISGPTKAIVSLISAASGIPQRVLLGSERGELASSQDRDEWAERIQDRRVSVAGPYVVNPLVDRLIEIGVLSAPSQYEARWPAMKSMDDLQKVEVAGKLANMNAAQGEVIVTTNEIRDRYLGLPPIEEVLSPEELAKRTAPAAENPLPRAARRAAKWAVLTEPEKMRYLEKVRVKGKGQPSWKKLHDAADRFPRRRPVIDREKFFAGGKSSE